MWMFINIRTTCTYYKLNQINLWGNKNMDLSYSILLQRINLLHQTVIIGQFNSRTTYNTSKWDFEELSKDSNSVVWRFGVLHLGLLDSVHHLVPPTGHFLETRSVSVLWNGSIRRTQSVLLDKVWKLLSRCLPLPFQPSAVIWMLSTVLSNGLHEALKLDKS
jgi:hypothetical protein